ncbi:hypothetical protein K438DRAFT_1770894 [Mycena galopus ATCC 62051]|nr:hypothetical protein K438DRAFT_1770894 [Mycena galopus ATCC 62051]
MFTKRYTPGHAYRSQHKSTTLLFFPHVAAIAHPAGSRAALLPTQAIDDTVPMGTNAPLTTHVTMASEMPESILLSAVSGNQSKDHTDRALVTPWLKFLWESYRKTLKTLKNNARLEAIYQVRDIVFTPFQRHQLRTPAAHCTPLSPSSSDKRPSVPIKDIADRDEDGDAQGEAAMEALWDFSHERFNPPPDDPSRSMSDSSSADDANSIHHSIFSVSSVGTEALDAMREYRNCEAGANLLTMTADGAKKPCMSNWNTSEGGSGTDPARTHLTALLGFSKSPTRACTTSLRLPSTCSPSAPQLRPSSPGCARAVCTLNEVYASVCIVFIMELVALLCDAAAEVSAAEAPTEGAEAKTKTVSYTFDPEAVEFYIMGCECCGELAVCVAFVDEPFGDVLDAPSPSTSSSSSAIKDGWDSSSRSSRRSAHEADLQTKRCKAVVAKREEERKAKRREQERIAAKG